MKEAVVLVAHGTVDDLAELPAFATRIRRGHEAPPELVEELRRRYVAIGGQSPLNGINRRLAAALEGALGIPDAGRESLRGGAGQGRPRRSSPAKGRRASSRCRSRSTRRTCTRTR